MTGNRSIGPVLAVSDLSTWGRVALSAGIPPLERRGIQVCALPTALLSSHGAYPGAVIHAQTAYMEAAIAHVEGLNPRFSALFTGFIAESAQFALLGSLASRIRDNGGIILADPVMGDNGRLYAFFDDSFVEAMRRHVAGADIITPNLTEAALLLGKAPDAVPADRNELRRWLERLSALGPRCVALTSAPVHGREDRTGVALYDAKNRRFSLLTHSRLAGGYPGTGDFFAAELLARMLKRAPFLLAARFAATRVRRAIGRTRRIGADPREGLKTRL